MASLYKRKTSRVIQFVGADGLRKTLYLGRVPDKTAQAIRTHVENLLNSKLHGQPFPRDTAGWLVEIGDDLHGKLSGAGLVEPRAKQGATKLAAFLDALIKGRTDLSPSTLANLKQTRDRLVEFFGEHRDLRTITTGELKDWRRWCAAQGYAEATVAMYVKKARAFFGDAVDRRVIPVNPAKAVEPGRMDNPDRVVYVPVGNATKLIDTATDAEWKLLFALARFNCLRIPSESNALTWADVDWERQRMTIRSPKTRRRANKGVRVVPLMPEVLPYLRDVFEAAAPGQAKVIVSRRGTNLRTQALRLIGRAGLTAWDKPFQNLRSSCETDWTLRFPIHVVCKWAGNTEAVAKRHYLQVTDEHFASATGQSAARCAAEGGGNDRKGAERMSADNRQIAFFPLSSEEWTALGGNRTHTDCSDGF